MKVLPHQVWVGGSRRGHFLLSPMEPGRQYSSACLIQIYHRNRSFPLNFCMLFFFLLLFFSNCAVFLGFLGVLCFFFFFFFFFFLNCRVLFELCRFRIRNNRGSLFKLILKNTRSRFLGIRPSLPCYGKRKLGWELKTRLDPKTETFVCCRERVRVSVSVWSDCVGAALVDKLCKGNLELLQYRNSQYRLLKYDVIDTDKAEQFV